MYEYFIKYNILKYRICIDDIIKKFTSLNNKIYIKFNNE